MGLTEEIHVLDKLRSGLGFSVVGCTFNVYEFSMSISRKGKGNLPV